MKDKIPPIYREGRSIFVLDQLALPDSVVYRRLGSAEAVADAIRRMVLRGAPLIGCAAAYGMALAAGGRGSQRGRLSRAAKLLLASRPTAVNLRHAVERMRAKGEAVAKAGGRGDEMLDALLREADEICHEDIQANLRMARLGASLLPRPCNVMTICNAGALATAGIGTAVGVLRWAWRSGKIRRVFACETRPYLQGSRLTMWELMRERIPCSLITDNMAAHIMKTERIGAVFTGADRIAANADAANKIGTYGLSILARHHGIPFYVVAPSTTVDLSTRDGGRIPIEERSSREVTEIAGRRIAPRGAIARHPAFDVTPHELITAIVTEKGLVRPVDGRRLAHVLKR